MKRCPKTIARTINLSQPKTCERPSPVRKLVSADVTSPCPSGETYKTPRPVSIRVCSRKEFERTCPPKLCDCPSKGPPVSKQKMMADWAMLMAKVPIAGGLVYWTSAEGFWGDSSQTEDLYYRMVKTVAPALPEFPDLDELKLPHLESIKHSIFEAYNHFVYSTIGGLAEIPAAVKRKIWSAIFPCEPDASSAETTQLESSKNPEEKDSNN